MTIKERMRKRQAFNPFISETPQVNLGVLTMSNATPTKKRRVMDYLAKGNSLTANQARSRFGVSNMRATMSNIKEQVERYGNWEVITNPTPTGLTSYTMEFSGYTDNPFAIRAGII